MISADTEFEPNRRDFGPNREGYLLSGLDALEDYTLSGTFNISVSCSTSLF